MNKCKDCGAEQIAGTLFCSECGGFMLDESGSVETDVLPFSEFAFHAPPRPLSPDNLQTAANPTKVTIVIPGSRRRLQLDMTDEIRIGRSTPDTVLELDLTEDQAAELGVSRIHAVIKASDNGLVLLDLDSTNGTYLNSYRIPSRQPYPLHSGDEIRFGDLLIHLFFD
ncbi:MAG TPA: FHA domain-containing protein [Chromatiaceae bacterium]|nr:FHA domain-containing protein [Chromatiaceae bacterium]